MPSMAVIIPAAGKGSRFIGDKPQGSRTFTAKKPFVALLGKPVWLYSAEKFASLDAVKEIILVVAPEDLEAIRQTYAADLARLGVQLAAGGKERFHSVENGLALVSPEIDYVAIHDAARPCVKKELIEAVFRGAIESGAAIPANPLVGTIKRVGPLKSPDSQIPADSLFIEKTEPREELWEAQTPQIFRKDLYQTAVARRESFSPTDDAGLMEKIGVPVQIIPSDRSNIKITTAVDLLLAECFLNESQINE